MKKRRVTVTLEVVTDAPLAILRNRKAWRGLSIWEPDRAVYDIRVLQAQANVIRRGNND